MAQNKRNQCLYLTGKPTQVSELREWEDRRYGLMTGRSFLLQQDGDDMETLYGTMFQAVGDIAEKAYALSKSGKKVRIGVVHELVPGFGTDSKGKPKSDWVRFNVRSLAEA